MLPQQIIPSRTFSTIYKLGTASSKLDEVPKFAHTQDVQEMQTALYSGSPEPSVSNLSFSHECSGVPMLVLKIK